MYICTGRFPAGLCVWLTTFISRKVPCKFRFCRFNWCFHRNRDDTMTSMLEKRGQCGHFLQFWSWIGSSLFKITGLSECLESGYWSQLSKKLRNIKIQTGSDAAAKARAEFCCVSKDAVESDQSLTFTESWGMRRESITSLVSFFIYFFHVHNCNWFPGTKKKKKKTFAMAIFILLNASMEATE